MGILKPAFTLLTIGGCWRPHMWTTKCKRILYAFYTTFVVLVLHVFVMAQFLNVVMNIQTTDDLSDNFYMFIATILACAKIITILANRTNIKIWCEKLQTPPCQAKNSEELAIQRNCDRKMGSVIIYYAVLVETTVFCMIVSSLFIDFRHRKLAYNVWMPFNYSSEMLYYVIYTHQLVGLIYTSILNVACDVIFCGLCVHVCSQQEILNLRLKEFPKQDSQKIGPLVEFHNYLYRYVSTMQEKFHAIIGIQLIASTMVVCFILYQLTNTPLISLRYLQFVLYMLCMLTQIFFYCWYGNALKLKSIEMVDRIFEINWTQLDNCNKRSLIIIMRRAMNPIELIGAYVFTMDLSTFVGIMRMYSAYNLLQRNKES